MKQIVMKGDWVVKMDDDVYPAFSKMGWHYGGGYAINSHRLAGGKRINIAMHRILLPPPPGKYVDHINGNKLDNRRENLRICTNSQNQYNAKLPQNNKSGYKGVSWNEKQKKWRAYGATRTVDNKKKTIALGGYDTKEEAYAAYVKHSKERGKEFFRHN